MLAGLILIYTSYTANMAKDYSSFESVLLVDKITDIRNRDLQMFSLKLKSAIFIHLKLWVAVVDMVDTSSNG